MLYIPLYSSIVEILLIVVPVLLSVAFVTVAERKTMASMQRRLGPNVVGYFGLLQAFADALKLLLKEYVSPTQANPFLFFLGPSITLIFSLLGFAVIPFAPGLSLFDFNLGILFILAVSSLATYGILLAGWSANSKYAFLGSLRSTAQLISYELILSSAIFLVILLTSNLNLTANIEAQRAIWYLAPLLPTFYIFYIGAIAETNRAPFDLAEAESELVSGFMTEHSAVIFVFFFLAEYASIVLICILMSVLFLGGYNLDLAFISHVFGFISANVLDIFNLILQIIIFAINDILYIPLTAEIKSNFDIKNIYSNIQVENLTFSLVLAIKTFILIFVFVWVRASFPRSRFDQLMSYCWTILLPLIFSYIIIAPCLLYVSKILPNNVLFFLFITNVSFHVPSKPYVYSHISLKSSLFISYDMFLMYFMRIFTNVINAILDYITKLSFNFYKKKMIKNFKFLMVNTKYSFIFIYFCKNK
jgi:NADH-ubiquinone oxidoreductase chain 1